ncbi:DinB family protein [compost metagenome]
MGQPYRKGEMLRFTLMHQAHHRGQMTVLMRQAGLRVPEVYGQTYESWIEAGMEPLK